MSDSLSIEPLSHAIPAKMVKHKDSSRNRQNHDKKKQKKKPVTDIIDDAVEEEVSENNDSQITTSEKISLPENKKKLPHFDGYA